MRPVVREVLLDVCPRLVRSLLDGGMECGKLALLVQFRFDHASVDQIGAVAARQIILRQQQAGERTVSAVRERVEVEGKHVGFAIADARKTAKNGASPRRVVRNTRLKTFARRHALQVGVSREKRENLREVGLARPEVTRNPNADLGRLVQKRVGEVFEHVVQKSLDHRGDDIAADLARQLVLVAAFTDLDDRLDLFLDASLKQICDLHGKTSCLVVHSKSPRYMNSSRLATNEY